MTFLPTDYPANRAMCVYRMDPVQRVCIEEFRGHIGLNELKIVAETVREDPSWSPSQHALLDFSHAQLDLSANDVLRHALLLRQPEYHTNGWMIYAVSDSAAFGTLRMLGHWSRNTERSRIFRSRQEAERWLELNANHIPPGFGSGFNVAWQPEVRNAG